MSATQNTELVSRALQMALSRQRPDGVVVHHSDQGCQRRIQSVVATPACWVEIRWSFKASAGVRQPSVLRGRVLSASATAASVVGGCGG